MSGQTLDTLSIELNNSSMVVYIGQPPSHVHTLLLGGNSTTLSALPRNHPKQPDGFPSSTSDTFSFSPSLLSSLAFFPSLRELAVSTYCAAKVDDRAYETWVVELRGLTSLKVGVVDVSKARPFASVGALLAALSTISECTENIPSRRISYLRDGARANLTPERPRLSAHRISTASPSHLHSRSVTDLTSGRPTGRRTGHLIAFFEDRATLSDTSFSHSRSSSMPGNRAHSPFSLQPVYATHEQHDWP